MKKVNLLLASVFFVTVWFFSTAISLACTNGSWKCDDGKLYKCKCTSTMFGTCILYDWSFQDDCLYGYCKSTTSCASCKKNASSCSGGKRTYCVGGSWKTVTCTYGCYNSTCASCSGSTNSGCSSGKVCIDNSCYTPVTGTCGTANGGTYSVAPSGTSLCAAGVATWVNGDQVGDDGTYNWTCKGEHTGNSTNCAALRKQCTATGVGDYGCLSASECSSKNGGATVVDTSCWCPNSGVFCKIKTCSQIGGVCRESGYCDAIGGKNSYPPSAPADCRSPSTGMCCIGGRAQTNECDNNDQCDLCETCDSVEINNSGYFYKKCQPHTFNGSCNNSIDGSSYCDGDMPSSGLCSYGSASSVSSNANSWSWTCNSSCGSDESCSAAKKPTINGVCGESNGGTFVGQPGGDLCTSGTVRWNGVSDDPNGDDGTYNWSCVGSCGGATAACSSIEDTPPSLDNLIITNISNVEVGPEEGGGIPGDIDYQGRNHICQTDFLQSRTIKFEVTATDPQGVTDIGDILLRFVSAGDTITTSAVPSNNGVANFTIGTSGFTPGTYQIEVQINGAGDTAHTADWVYAERDFKFWDCLVDVTGTVYDGSAGVSCSSNQGFSSKIPAIAGFGVIYGAGTSSPRVMSVTSAPDFRSGDKLYWNSNSNYIAQFNNIGGDPPSQVRVNGTTCVDGLSLDPKLADPYSSNPSLNLEYSSIMNQDAWFSVTDASVLSAGKVTNYVPVTCTTDSCKTSVNGVVWSKGKSTLSTYDKGSSQQKMSEKSLVLKDTSYKYFFSNYFSKLGIGTTFGTSKNWSEISSSTGVIMINGNLNINQNTDNNFRVIIVNGNIDIGSSVNSVNAVLIGKAVTASGNSASQLKINGSIYTTGGVTLNRSFTSKSDNNDTPAVLVTYDPSVMFKMPKEVAKAVTQWRMN